MELGSEYNLDLNSLSLKADNVLTYLEDFSTIYTDSGRSALKLLLSTLNSTSILIPNYICDSVISSIPQHYNIEYYPIDHNFSLDMDFIETKLASGTNILYIMNYFGKLLTAEQQSLLLKLKDKYHFTIIEDTTHSLLSSAQTIGDYCICSLRKWFPIPDGGVLYSSSSLDFIDTKSLNPKPLSNKLVALLLKNLYLKDLLDCHDLYRSIFVDEEESLDHQTELFGISLFTYDLLKYFSITEIKNRRIKNYNYLSFFICETFENALPIDTSFEVPFSFPLFIPNRDLFRRFLIDHNIFCAVHWPLGNTPLCTYETPMNISNSIISLPIDQRYDEVHMNYLIDTLKMYLNLQYKY